MEENFQRFDLEVPRPPLPTAVIIGKDILRNIPDAIDLSGYTQFVIVIEDQLRVPFGSKLEEGLRKTGKSLNIFTSEGSELNKTEKEADRIINNILTIEPQIDRKLAVFAVGGGVIGDVAGYCAGRTLRGVDIFQVPTTLLAMVDSSLGGKTAVDHGGIKNKIGSFHLPRATIMDTDVLKSLPERQITSGFAEFVKHAFLDPEIFKFISGENARTIMDNGDKLIEGLKLSAKYKMSIVGQDYEEKTGIRQVLNFGHTLGQAIEAAAGLEKLTHGEAVAIGMAGIILMSNELKMLSDQDKEIMLGTMKRFNLPTSTSRIVDIDRKLLWKIIAQDKKAINGVPKFVLPEGVGRFKVGCSVDKEIVNHALDLIAP
ncbi:MAG: 3-dehydroquinate synthase family protein [Candidatus Levybacteria bacterium]|nr:3-dehydroquinate synthase family protein [Candidatus Levybacteria bacterium]